MAQLSSIQAEDISPNPKPQTLKPKLTVTLGEAPLPCVTQLLDEMLGESDSTEAMGFELRWCSSAGFT